MNDLVLFFLSPPSWETGIVWMQLNKTFLLCVGGSFSGTIASYPFIDKRKISTKLWNYTFTSWSMGFVLSFLVAENLKLGTASTIAEAFAAGLGGFYAAKQLFNRNKDKDVDGKGVFTNRNADGSQS